MKTCSVCLESKEETSFVVQKATKDRPSRLQSSCKKCKNKKYRKFHLMKRYGMTLADYEALLSKQGSRCAICLSHESENHKGLFVDHDHKTGKVRGLLCSRCNLALGHVKDDTSLLERLIGYIS